MKVTTFYSYKGGLGRSLLLAWSARALAAKGHSVVALDLDLEAPGLAFKLGFGPDDDPGPGVVGLLRRFLSGEPPPESIEPWLRPVPDEENLRLLPAGPSPSAEYWQALASISWEELFFGPDPQGARFFTWLREAIEDAANPDHLLVDARTGVTELGGAALTLMADQILALLGTSPEGVYGTREVLRSVMAAPHPSETEVPRIGLILARMPATLATPALQRLRRVVRGQITEEADPLSATVAVDLPLVVRSEPSLQEDESRALRREDLRVHEDYATVLDWLLGGEVPEEAPGLVYRSDEGLSELKATIELQRKAAERDPDIYLPDLADSLQNLSSSLAGEGRWEQALYTAREAVQVYWELAKAEAETYKPKLASSLINLGVRLSELGRREEALDATREAVEHYRELAESRPDAFLPDLAGSLNNLGNTLSALGRRENALAASREAVEHYRDLAADRPDAFLPYLAMSLTNLGPRLSALERREDALAATREAVEYFRELAKARPDAFLPNLAASLNNLGIMLSAVGRREDAVDATREAVEIRRELAQARPDVFLPDLANSLDSYGSALFAGGRAGDATEAFDEGLSLLLPFAKRLPDAFRDLTLNLARRLSKASDDPDTDLLDRVREIYGDDWDESGDGTDAD